jgi:hypothetical protein
MGIGKSSTALAKSLVFCTQGFRADDAPAVMLEFWEVHEVCPKSLVSGIEELEEALLSGETPCLY